MSSAEMKSQIIDLLGRDVDETTLSKIIVLLRANSRKGYDDWADELPHEVQESLNISIQQAKDGEVVSHELVMDELRKEFPHLKF